MKELSLYINFFHKFFKVIIVLALIGALVGYWLQLSKSAVYKVKRLWEFDTQSVTEQAVTYLRSQNLAEEFKLDKGSKVIVHKNGPLSIELEVQAQSQENLKQAFKKVKEFVKENFKVQKVGEDVYLVEQSNSSLGLLGGFLVGAILGVLISLTVTYLKNF